MVRYVYVPEEWSRNERRQHNLPGILGTVCTVALVGIVLGVSIVGVIHWSRRRGFSARTFFTLSGLLFLISVINILNNWPVRASEASTAQPLALQAAIVLSVSVVLAIFTAAALALAAGLVAARRNFSAAGSPATYVTAGVSLGFAFAGIGAVARHALPQLSPLWGNLGPASAFVPAVTAALSPLTAFFIQSIILLTIVHALAGRTRAGVFWILVGLALAGSTSIETIPSWLIIGATTGIVLMLAYVVAFRHQPILVVFTAATVVILSALRDGIQHPRSEEHTSELQSRGHLVCRLL